MRWMKLTACLIVLEIALMLPEARGALAYPNDPLLKSQWGWYDVLANYAYNSSFHGQGIKVAVLDTGVDANHRI